MKRFVRTIEDFICEQCATEVTGDGYTNHCPKCLWSKHVDQNPGDRASPCKGSMEPLSVSVVPGGAHRIIHRCVRCGFIRAQETAKEDSMERVIELSINPFRESS